MEESNTINNKNGGFKIFCQKLRARLLNSYYGNPVKDLKLIVVAGMNGKSIVANFIYDILREDGKKVAILTSDKSFKTAVLHKFLNDAWKAENEYVVVTAPVESVKNNVFYGLPIHILAITDFNNVPEDISLADYIKHTAILLENKPEIVILNHDDTNYSYFNNQIPSNSIVSYGSNMDANFKILNFKLYSKGSEATLAFNGSVYPVASFTTGSSAPFYMACAAATTSALGISYEKITYGLTNYAPKDLTNA